MKNNLVDELFNKSKTYRMGIFCTYSLNIEFLENYILNLNGVNNCSNLTIFTDRKIYNDMFNMYGGCKPRWINKRYLLTPIDTNGVFHPKLYLLASDKEIRFGIGSANLTREGLATNLEIVSVFEVSMKDRTYLSLLKECLEFIKNIAIHSKSPSAIQSVKEFIEYISDLLIGDSVKNINLFHNVEESICEQVENALDKKIVKTIMVISPFYDKELSIHKILKNKYPEADFYIYIQQGKSNFPINDYVKDETKLFVYKEQERYIHGKALLFETNDGWYMLTGSSNYTRSAMLSKNFEANVETSIWGSIDDETVKYILSPNGIKPVELKNYHSLTVIESEKEIIENNIIDDWLIEASIANSVIHFVLNESKVDVFAKYIVFNGKEEQSIAFQKDIYLDEINKSDIAFVQLEGINKDSEIVYSGKVWLIDLDVNRGNYGKKKLYITDPSQLPEIIQEYYKNGNEEELIEYLLSFNIPLDLVGINIKGRNFRAIESKGNVFGELFVPKARVFNNPKIIEAVRQFLINNYNKLCVHEDNIQLTKLDNFVLIFGTIFSMIDTFNTIVAAQYKKNPIGADDWSTIRTYYNTFLEFIESTLQLLWYNSEVYASFAEKVNREIRADKQKMLGSINSFQEYIIKQGYVFEIENCYTVSKRVIKRINLYLTKGKVLTKSGTLVSPQLAKNGIQDTYIIRLKEIYAYVLKLEEELRSYKDEF